MGEQKELDAGGAKKGLELERELRANGKRLLATYVRVSETLCTAEEAAAWARSMSLSFILRSPNRKQKRSKNETNRD